MCNSRLITFGIGLRTGVPLSYCYFILWSNFPNLSLVPERKITKDLDGSKANYYVSK